MSNVRPSKSPLNNSTKDLTFAYSNDYSEESVASSIRDTVVQDQIKLSHCRLCAQEKDCDDLLDLNIYDTETCELYLSILDFFKIDFIKLSNYNIPKTTCESCYNAMLECYHFFHNVKEAQIILIELYGAKPDNDDKLIKTEIGSESPKYENTEERFGRKSRLSSLDSNTSKQSQSIDNQDNEYGPKIDQLIVDNTPSITQELEDNCDNVSSSRNTPEPEDNYKNTSTSSSSTPPESDNDCENISISSKSSAADYFPMKYCGFPIFNDTVMDTIIHNDNNDDDESWNTYPWFCMHCQVECDSMKDLRLHSVQLHKKCYAFKCDDCDSLIFYTFNTFIEHVRQHRDELRYYCPHCNEHFESVSDCSNHTLSHWSEGQRICDWCGEIFPDENALKLHKSESQPMRQSKKLKSLKPRIVAPVRKYNGLPVFENESNMETDFRTWDDYQWTCRECLLHVPSAQLLRIHTQEMHSKCFAMKCIDCPFLLRTFNQFVIHVTGHRPQLKNYCPYCNENLKPEDFKKHIDGHLKKNLKPCYQCGQVFENKQQAYQHYEKFQPLRRNLTTEDLTCDVCGSIFNKLPSLRLHKKTHDKNRQKEHTCDTCGKQFYTKGSLKHHLTTHGNRNHICKVCNKGYLSARHLRIHVRRHLKKDNFICDYCSKGYREKSLLRDHIKRIHMHIVKRIKCQICNKSLSSAKSLRIHMSTHTGERPYKCQNCDKCFRNWANCNKHMVRIHKTTLSNTKLTEHGRIPIGKISNGTNVTADTEQWMHEVAKSTRKTTCKKS